MAYTPELTYHHSCTLRRIAWALKMPMTKAIGEILDHISSVVDGSKICEGCRDRTRCQDCIFNGKEEIHD